jgi:RNA-binding protein
MSLTGKQLKFLRAEAQRRKPVVTVGAAGLSAAVVAEVDLALAHHELLKVKLPAGDHALHQEMIDNICAQTGAEPVQTIGRVAVVYRRAKKPLITLPSA